MPSRNSDPGWRRAGTEEWRIFIVPQSMRAIAQVIGLQRFERTGGDGPGRRIVFLHRRQRLTELAAHLSAALPSAGSISALPLAVTCSSASRSPLPHSTPAISSGTRCPDSRSRLQWSPRSPCAGRPPAPVSASARVLGLRHQGQRVGYSCVGSRLRNGDCFSCAESPCAASRRRWVAGGIGKVRQHDGVFVGETAGLPPTQQNQPCRLPPPPKHRSRRPPSRSRPRLHAKRHGFKSASISAAD